jgi:hypothetical protein
MRTAKRRAQASGLEVYALSSDVERATMKALKAEFDPLNVFWPHLRPTKPEIHFVGERSGGYAA